MALVELDLDAWAQVNFGDAGLGDVRRTRRLVTVAAQSAAHPDGGTPEQTKRWADCKAAYRLFDCEKVTFDNVCETHWRLTRNQTSDVWLLIGDTTEIDFTSFRSITGLGPTGNGGGRGFFLHSSMMINAQTEEIAGIAASELFYRTDAPDKETWQARKNRSRESEVWGRVIDQVGPPPGDARFIHVLDAGADNYEVFAHLEQQQCGYVIRAAQKHRHVLTATGERMPLQDYVQTHDVSGTYELYLRARKGQPARNAKLEVRVASIQMPQPVQKTPFMKACGIETIAMRAIEVREVNAPKGVTPLHWLLLTSEPIDSFDDAWKVISWYEKRATIEDYHKCLKTGCRLESRQYETSERLERVTGLLSVVAVRLLQLKFVARVNPDQPVTNVVPASWVRMLNALNRRQPITTVGQFFRGLAMHGGFLGRKHDGEPGWITIWRGFKKLQIALDTEKALTKKCG